MRKTKSTEEIPEWQAQGFIRFMFYKNLIFYQNKY